MTARASLDDRCDNRSVGVLLRRDDGRLLTFERARPPAGVAAVAGHVDRHGTPEQAARAEVREEVGLSVVHLDRIVAAWRPNVCRRSPGPEGLGHHWVVFTATASGQLSPSAEETRQVRWRTGDELQQLADRTIAHARGAVTEEDFRRLPGIEPVWVRFLVEAGVVRASEADLDHTESLSARPLVR